MDWLIADKSAKGRGSGFRGLWEFISVDCMGRGVGGRGMDQRSKKAGTRGKLS